MEFYNDPLKVDEYEKMCDEYDGAELYKILSNHLKENSTLLELGCGPGNDIANLQKNIPLQDQIYQMSFYKDVRENLLMYLLLN